LDSRPNITRGYIPVRALTSQSSPTTALFAPRIGLECARAAQNHGSPYPSNNHLHPPIQSSFFFHHRRNFVSWKPKRCLVKKPPTSKTGGKTRTMTNKRNRNKDKDKDKDKDEDEERDVRLFGAAGETGQDFDFQDRMLGWSFPFCACTLLAPCAGLADSVGDVFFWFGLVGFCCLFVCLFDTFP
jgi:hypothetical protein